MSSILAAVLKRDRAIVGLGLAGVATLAWIYLIYMDWGMRHMDVGMNTSCPPCSIGQRLSCPLPVPDGVFGDRMAGWPRGRIQDGTEARQLLSRLLLGIDGSLICLWSDEPLMGCLYQRLCPAGEDHLGEPMVQSTWRA